MEPAELHQKVKAAVEEAVRESQPRDMSPEVDQIQAALAKAQGEMGPAVLDRTVKVATKKGRDYEFSYATLSSIYIGAMGTVDNPGPLPRNGLCLVQLASTTADAVTIITHLGHESGQWFRSTYKMPVEAVAAHAIGSATSYAKRYAASAMIFLPSDSDDDARGAQDNAPEPMEAKVAEFKRLTRSLDAEEVEAKLQSLGVSHPGDLSPEVLDACNAKMKIDQAGDVDVDLGETKT